MKYIDLKREVISRGHTNWYYSLDLQNYGGNVVYKKYSDVPDSKDFFKIKTITFSISPNDHEKIEFLPKFISDIHDLESLTIPLDWVNELDIPKKIETLILTKVIANTNTIQKWPENLILDNLQFLQIPESLKTYDFDIDKFPNLEWISYDFNSLTSKKASNPILKLSKLKNLKHLIFSQVKNIDVFSPFYNHNIESLELFSCTSKNLEIDKIKGLKKLKYIYINNIKTIFDCKLIDEFPELIELNLLNVKNVININHVLKHKNIKTLIVRNCKNPFEQVGKSDFENKEFDHLDIQFA